MKKILITTILLSFSQLACKEDFLSITPETALSTDTFFTKEADFQQAVNATYVPLRTIMNDRGYLLGEMHSDNAYYFRNILFGATEPQEDIADFSVPTANGASGIPITPNVHVLNQYRQDFAIIARANQVLDLIDKVEFDAARKANMKGQVQLLRAFAYYELVRYFGTAPLHLVPVTVRQEAALPLATSAQLYTQIIADATAAIGNLLPKSTQEPGRVTSGTARLLLADVYMTQKKYAEAEKLLKEMVSSNEYSLMPEYADAFSTNTGNKNNKESVFEVQYLEGAAGFNGTFIYNFLPRPMSADELKPISGTSNPQPLTGEGNNAPTPDLIASYQAGDKRLDATIAYVTISGSLRDNKVYPYVKKYAKTHSLHGNTGTNWPIYRYAEALLFLAEALNEQGKTAEAATYLNMVRKRAGLADATAASQADMALQIAVDRRSELAFENKRWFDLVRSGKAVEVITAYGARIKANPEAYYYPKGSTLRSNSFSNLSLTYGLPADESSLNDNF
ncbi:MAG: RagB/SusD family nutrient uptake outer membrane protein [Bacteroidota bacterium]